MQSPWGGYKLSLFQTQNFVWLECREWPWGVGGVKVKVRFAQVKLYKQGKGSGFNAECDKKLFGVREAKIEGRTAVIYPSSDVRNDWDGSCKHFRSWRCRGMWARLLTSGTGTQDDGPLRLKETR